MVLLHANGHPMLCEPRNTLELIERLVGEGILTGEQGAVLGRAYRGYLRQSLDLKLLDRPVLIPRSELTGERESVAGLWGKTFG